MEDPFVRLTRAEIATLQAREQVLAEEEVRVADERRLVRDDLQRAETALAYYVSRMTPVNTPMPDADEVKPIVASQNGASGSSQTTIGGACEAYLVKLGSGKSATAVVLMEELQRLGRLTSDRRKAYRLVSATLSRDKRFSKVAPGVWQLALSQLDPSTTVASPNGIHSSHTEVAMS